MISLANVNFLLLDLGLSQGEIFAKMKSTAVFDEQEIVQVNKKL